MESIELYKTVKCWDCQNIWKVSGSSVVALIKCPSCNSNNWDEYKPIKNSTNLKTKKHEQ